MHLVIVSISINDIIEFGTIEIEIEIETDPYKGFCQCEDLIHMSKGNKKPRSREDKVCS